MTDNVTSEVEEIRAKLTAVLAEGAKHLVSNLDAPLPVEWVVGIAWSDPTADADTVLTRLYSPGLRQHHAEGLLHSLLYDDWDAED